MLAGCSSSRLSSHRGSGRVTSRRWDGDGAGYSVPAQELANAEGPAGGPHSAAGRGPIAIAGPIATAWVAMAVVPPLVAINLF